MITGIAIENFKGIRGHSLGLSGWVEGIEG